MKRVHKVEIAGRTLDLSMSFSTSLTIMEKVKSPSDIVESIWRAQDDPKAEPFRFTERNAATILSIASGLDFEEAGELIMEHGTFPSYQLVLKYLQELIIGRSKEAEKVAEAGDSTAEK